VRLLKGIFGSLLPRIKSVNVTSWIVASIQKGTPIKDIYQDLKTDYVGDKLRGYILRDIITFFNFESMLKREDHLCLQAIDTWVKQVCVKLWGKDIESMKDRDLKEKIVSECIKCGVSPVEFNQGMWFLGSNSLECIFEYYIYAS